MAVIYRQFIIMKLCRNFISQLIICELLWDTWRKLANGRTKQNENQTYIIY